MYVHVCACTCVYIYIVHVFTLVLNREVLCVRVHARNREREESTTQSHIKEGEAPYGHPKHVVAPAAGHALLDFPTYTNMIFAVLRRVTCIITSWHICG